MIKAALSYLRTNIIKKQIVKPKENEESITFYNYPYQALEEAVVNSLYHRDWTIQEPVEITIEPDRISILSFSGPNHTIPMDAVREGRSLRSRRYRNRRLGEFLKELDLTEGRATGIPTIQDELRSNGSPLATIETDDERSFFLIDIPCHPQFVQEQVMTNRDFVKDFVKGNLGQLSERQIEILQMIAEDGTLTSQKISQKIGVAQRTIQIDLAKLQTKGILIREGGRKEGLWVIVADR